MSERKPYNFEKRHWLWPLLNLNTRFLNSDFLANYSRGYVWAANQLGHFTLGLIVAMGYFWFADTLYRAFSSIGGARYGGGLARMTSWSDVSVAIFAITVTIGIVASLAVLIWRITCKPRRYAAMAVERQKRIDEAHAFGLTVPPEEFELLRITKRRLNGELAERAGLYLGLTLFLGGAAVILMASFGQNVRGAFEWRAYAGSVLVTTFFFATLAALLSQSAHYTLMSWTVLAAAALMWEPRTTDAAGVPVALPIQAPELLSPLTDQPLLAALAALFVVLLAFTRLRDSYGRAPWRIILVISIFFLVGALAPDPETRRAVAAAFASLGVWWVKEFGSDLPTVEAELQNAHYARVVNGVSKINGVRHAEDYAKVRAECYDDTLCDARTDGLFYLAGTAMAIGLLMAPRIIDNETARIVPAFLAAILFLVVYWWVGWWWIRRAIALDRVLVVASQRFAMIESAVMTRIMVGDMEYNPAPQPETPAGPMQRLHAFARNELKVGDTPVQHMVICGQFGSGRSPLGHALACEAALSNAPPWSAAPERRGRGPMRWARYISLRGVFERYVFGTRSKAQDEELISRIGAPDLFVIDQADAFAMETIEAYRLWGAQNASANSSGVVFDLQNAATRAPSSIVGGPGSARSRLLGTVMQLLHVDLAPTEHNVAAEDQTAWITFADVAPPEPGERWEPEIPPMARQFAIDLAFALEERSDGALRAEEIPIAIVIVGRPYRRPDLLEAITPNHGGDGERELIADATGI
ncbi:MAG: hypothetical protein MRY74_15210 [Neomegalonema sp.]|nr:hypothetical protein [Neomegalonema sp.]